MAGTGKISQILAGTKWE